MKYLLIYLMTIFSTMTNAQKKEELFIKKFFTEMNSGIDVRKYVDPNFIKQNFLENKDWQCDYVLFKNIEIGHFDNYWIVKMFPIKGEKCSSMKIYLIEIDDKLFIVPSELTNLKLKNKTYPLVVPWHLKKGVDC